MKNTELLLESVFQTNDLSLATVISLYYPIEAIDKTNPHKVIFLFKRKEGLDGLVETYWRRDLTIEPQALFQQLRTLKTRLYGER